MDLGRTICNNTHLTTVDFYNNALNDHTLALLFRGWTQNTTVRRLNLHNNDLSISGVQSMVPFLQRQNNLTFLCLGHNVNIQSEGFNILLRALSNSPIEELDCYTCRIESFEIDSEHIPKYLEKLNLKNNFINTDGCQSLAKLLQGCALKDLNLCQNEIDNNGVELLAVALQSNTSLTTLGLSHNEVDDEGVAILANALQRNATLTELYLSDNEVANVGVAALAAVLQRNATLTTLGLGNNEIGDEGVAALADALQSNATLTALDLSGNKINDGGTATLAAALQSNATLTTLNLSNNKIKDDGVAALAAALQSNATLKHLGLANNDVSYQGKISLLKLVIDISSIKATLQSNHILEDLSVDDGDEYDDEYDDEDEIQQFINEAVGINSWEDSPEVAGREKVRRIQLHRAMRVVLAELQGVTHSLYSEIDTLYLPEVLSLISRYHKLEDLFSALKSTMAGLLPAELV